MSLNSANDPEYQERVRQRDEKIRIEDERLARAEAPLVEEMRATGADINSVWDPINTEKKYPELVPILLAHLDKDYPDRVREEIRASSFDGPGSPDGLGQACAGLSQGSESDRFGPGCKPGQVGTAPSDRECCGRLCAGRASRACRRSPPRPASLVLRRRVGRYRRSTSASGAAGAQGQSRLVGRVPTGFQEKGATTEVSR